MSNSSSYFDGKGDCLVLCDILSRLPVKSLMRFKCVSKRWEWIITRDPYFIDLHLTSSKTWRNSEHNSGSNTTTILIYQPFLQPNEPIQIRRILFSKEDLVFHDCQGESSETSVIPSLSCPYFGNDITFDLKASILEPVYGLFCFVSREVREDTLSVLIYNPSTREKTPWIKTNRSSEIFESIFSELEVSKNTSYRARDFTTYRSSKSMFGFGMDPITKQHKVICLHLINYRRTSCRIRGTYKAVCNVMTVGENTWRQIDTNHIPPDIYAGDVETVHVNGSIYWMRKLEGKYDAVMVFDVGSERIRLIEIPNIIQDPLRFMEIPRLARELVEVDGQLTLLVREGIDQLSLWVYNVNAGVAGCNWIKETMQMPCHWSEIVYVTLKAIAHTDLIVMKILQGSTHDQHSWEHRECLHYYNRKEKKYYKDQFEILLGQGGHCISTFFETLLPVQIIQKCELIN